MVFIITNPEFIDQKCNVIIDKGFISEYANEDRSVCKLPFVQYEHVK